MTGWISGSSKKILDDIDGLARTEIVEIRAVTPKLPEDLQDFVSKTEKQKGNLEDILRKIIGFWKSRNEREKNQQNKWREEPTDVAQHNRDRARFSGQASIQSENEELRKIKNTFEKNISISDARWQAREMDLKQQISKLQSEKEDLRKSKNALQEDKSICDARSQIREVDLKRQMATMQHESRAEKEKLNTAHQAEVRRLWDGHQTSVKELEAKHQKERQSLLKENNDLSLRHESEIRNQRILMAKTKRESESKIEGLIKNFEAQKLRMTGEMADEKARIETEFQEKQAQIIEFHRSERERLQKDINAYAAELMRQDNFKAIPDIEIRSKFQAIAQDIEALARMEWRPDQTKWPVRRLQQLSANQRALKMQILQDIMWSVLDEFIFSTPFRVFGEEGQSLAKAWYEACANSRDESTEGQGYKWPPPEMETERWRYVTIKECRAALRQPVPSEWDPRAKLKKGFKTTLEALKSEFIKRLGEIALIEDGHTQDIERLTRTAAGTWLEFGAQRCRLMVVLKDPNLTSKNTEQMERERAESLSLVMVPALKRFGNSKGDKLDEVEETIRGCDAEIAKYRR